MADALVVQLTAEQLVEMVAARVVAILKNGNGHAPDEPDRLLDAKEAAAVLGTTPRWLYANASTLGFMVRLPGRSVRFSSKGIARYIERRMGR